MPYDVLLIRALATLFGRLEHHNLTHILSLLDDKSYFVGFLCGKLLAM